MTQDDHKVFNNSKTARKNALAALAKAKEVESYLIKNGAKWNRQDKTARLVRGPKQTSGRTSTRKTKNTGTS